MTHGTQKFKCFGDNLWDVQQLGREEGGLSKISEIKYSAKSVDMHIYVYIDNRVHYKWAIHLLSNGLLFGWSNSKYEYSLKLPPL